jgi:hypothetical protein
VKWLVIAALVFAAGCKKKQAEPTPAPAPGSAMAGSAMAPEPPPPATGSATAAAGSAVDVPTEQDFEAKAATDITDKNVGDKLKSIEADLANQ